MHSTKKRDDIRARAKEIIALYRDKTSYEIAPIFGVSRCLITKILKENGCKMRPTTKRKGIPPWNKGKRYDALRGKKNPNWKGGITPVNGLIRHLPEYREWIDKIFRRDNWRCVECKKRGGNLEADHFPIPFSEILKKYRIKSVEDALKCRKLWDIANGRTLCLKCHNRTKQVRSRFKKWSNKQLD